MEPWMANSVEMATAISTAELIMPHLKPGKKVRPQHFLPIAPKKTGGEIKMEDVLKEAN